MSWRGSESGRCSGNRRFKHGLAGLLDTLIKTQAISTEVRDTLQRTAVELQDMVDEGLPRWYIIALYKKEERPKDAVRPPPDPGKLQGAWRHSPADHGGAELLAAGMMGSGGRTRELTLCGDRCAKKCHILMAGRCPVGLEKITRICFYL